MAMGQILAIAGQRLRSMNAARHGCRFTGLGRAAGRAVFLFVFAALAFASGASAQAAEGDLRIVDGISSSQGRLEIFLGGRWGTVCDDRFQFNNKDGSQYNGPDAVVACRQLGYAGGIASPHLGPQGPRAMPILLTDARCTGSEARLIDCPHNRNPQCYHFEDVAIACDTTELGPPGRLSAEPGDGKVALSWDAPSSVGGAAVERYEYRYGESGASFGAWTSTGTATTVTVGGLANGRSHIFEVRAVNSVGAGDAAASIAVIPGPPPFPPRDLTAAVADIVRVSLSWKAPASATASAISGYEYRYRASDGSFGAWTSAGAALGVTVGDLTPGRSYIFEVRAVNSIGAGAAASKAAMLPADPPQAPYDLRAASGLNAKVLLMWKAPANTGSAPISHYEYRYRASDESFGPWSDAAPRNAVVYGLTNNTTYVFEVRARNRFGASGSVSKAATPREQIPTPPIFLSATGDDRRVLLTWRVPALDGGAPISGYEYRYRASDGSFGAWTSVGAALRVTVGGLTDHTAYVFEVRARNRVGGGERARISKKPGLTPGPPEDLTAAANHRQVSLSWSVPSHSGVAPILRYEYRFAASGDAFGAWRNVNVGRELRVTVDGLTDGSSYVFEVRARNARGAGDAASKAATPRPDPPGAPRHLSTTAGDGQVRLAWDAPASDGGASIIRYEYRHREIGAGFGVWTSAGTTTAATVAGLANGRSHAFEVRAVNSAGAGDAAEVSETLHLHGGGLAEGDLRIVDGISSSQGRLEIFLGGRWGTVCDDRFQFNNKDGSQYNGPDAVVACRQLGYAGGIASPHLGPQGPRAMPILLTDARCTGSEARLIDCPHNRNPQCYHYEDVAISCDTTELGPPGRLSAEPGDGKVALSWDAPSSVGGAAVERYEYRYGESGASFGAWTSTGTQRTATVTGLVNGRRYAFEVRAVNSVGAGGAAGVAETPAAPPLRSFTLVDTATGADLLELREGTVVDLGEHATDSFGVRADAAAGAAIGSVGFELTGAQSHLRTDNDAPYSLYGDAGGRLEGRALSAGAYRLRATVHAERNLGGHGVQTLTVAFTVVAAPVSADATLRSLTLDGVTLAPSFGGATERYTASVGHGVTSVTVAAAPSDASATVVFDPAADADPGAAGRQVALAVGDTVITVTVTAGDGTTKTYTVTVTRAGALLTSFTLVDAAANEDLLELREGTVVDLGEHATDSFGMRADAAAGAAIGSVDFELTGQQSHSQTENLVPYSLYGDAGGRLKGRALSAGAYRLRATVHAERNLGGAALQTLAVAFTVAAPVSADATLRALTLEGVTLAPSFGGATERYTASVGHGVTSVTVAAAPSDASATVAFDPAADADPGTPGHQVALAAGDTVITVTVTAGDATTTKTYTVTVTRAGALLTSFTLVDAAANEDLLELREGTVVDLGEHATDSFGVRADAAPGAAIGSVGFELTGQQSQSKTENLVPYSLYGDADGRLKGRALSAGAYRLSATVHAEPDLGGAALQTLAVAFTVVAPPPPVSADATLRSLTLDGVTLAPSFGGATERYTASVGHGVTSVTVAAAPSDANATVAFRPAADADPGTPGHQVALAAGDTAIAVTVTAGDGTTTKTYTVTVTRAGAPAVEVSFGQAAYSAAEGGAAAAVTVRLSADPERAVTVALTASGAGGATAGDWSLAPARVTFSSGETSKTVTVTAVDDAVDDDGESVVLGFAGLPEGVSPGSRVTATVSIADNDDPAIAAPEGICGRTPAVRDQIMSMLTHLHRYRGGCAEVTAAELAKVEFLELFGRGMGGLKPGDFAGLSGLAELSLRNNALDSLPAGVFADLTALTELELSGNRLRTLPAAVFDGLGSLTGLNLRDNALDPIPFAAFEALPALTELGLYGNPGYRSGLEVSPQALRIARGATGEYRLRLTSSPTLGPRRATVSVSSENAGVTAAPATVTFTEQNWFRAQAVTVRVAGSAAPGASTLSHAVSGYTVKPGPPAVTVEIAAAAGSAKTAGPPRVAGVSVAAPVGGGSYAEGEPIEATVRFGEAVTVDTSGGTPTIALRVGGSGRVATYVRGSGTRSLVFGYEAAAADAGAARARVVSGSLKLNGATIRNGAGLDADPAFHVAPVVTGVSVAWEPGAGGSYAAGGTIVVNVAFSEPVRVDTENGRPAIGLVVSGHARRAVYASGSGTRLLVFAYEVTAADGAARGVVAPANGLAPNGGTIRGGSGLDADLAHPGAAAAGAALAVSDARVREAAGAVLAFRVTLSPAAGAEVTVDYATADGTAAAGEDYTERSGTLTFAPGETERTVAVAVLEDAKDEGEESFTLRLSNASGGRLADAEAVGTIVNTGPLPKAWLARFGRAAASHVVDAVGERLGGSRRGSQVTIAGRRLPLGAAAGSAGRAEPRLHAWDGRGPERFRGLTGRELLLGSSFSLWLGADGDGPAAADRRWAAWGRAAAARFEGRDGALALDGDVLTATLGVDAGWAQWLAGVAVSHSTGEGAFEQSSGQGKLKSTLIGVHPYARYELSERVSLWGVLGYGIGDLTYTEDGAEGGIETDIAMRMGAVGVRGVLLPAPETGGFELAARSDALAMRMRSEAVSRSADSGGNLAAAAADTSRLRLVLEGSRGFDLASGGRLTPSLEVGLRHDGGDAETGTGVELGAGLRYTDPARGLTMEASVRALVAHEESGYEEWGARGAVRLDPDASGRGLTLTLTPTLGVASSGVERLWSRHDPAGLAADGSFDAARRLEAELGYGLAGPAGLGVATPYAGLSLSEGGGRSWRLGTRWKLGPTFTLGIEGTRRETGNDNAPDHGLELRGQMRF